MTRTGFNVWRNRGGLLAHRFTHRLAALAIAAGLGACAHQDTRFVGVFTSFKDCRARFAAIDARIDAAGVRDASYYRVPGYPYLRSDRTLASFRNELEGVDQIGGWLRHLREYDQEAREFEYINLGLSLQEAAILRYDLQSCGRGLAAVELDDPDGFAALSAAVTPTDDYSDQRRALHAYALIEPALRRRVAQRQAAVRREFEAPLPAADDAAPLRLWQVQATADTELPSNGYGNSPSDELGFPGLFDSGWQALAERNAPSLWIETQGARDQPGAPRLTAHGATVDPAQPVLYYQIGFTRFGDQRLAQVTYLAWFARDDADTVDGILWRVTLDANAQPLLYESLNVSGRDHLWFPTPALTLRRDLDPHVEAPLLPQPARPAGPQALRLRSGTHALRRVVDVDLAQSGDAPTQRYLLRRYEDLFTLPLPDGGSHSLFDADGLVRGSHGDGDWLEQASGVLAAGAPRQLGHHAVTQVGRVEFDDPRLLESVFVAPAAQPPSN